MSKTHVSVMVPAHNEEKYVENKAVIEKLVLELFENSDMRGI